MSIQFEHCHEGTLRNFHLTYLAHTLLTLLLFFQQLPLSGDVTSVALGGYVFTDLAHCLSGNDLCTYGSLDCNVKLLAGDEFLELFADFSAELIGVVLMDES